MKSMCAMVNEILVQLAELSRASITCGYCGAEVIVSLDSQLDVTHCPACHRDFDPAVKENLVALAQIRLSMKTSRHKLAFRIAALRGQ